MHLLVMHSQLVVEYKDLNNASFSDALRTLTITRTHMSHQRLTNASFDDAPNLPPETSDRLSVSD